MGKEYFLCYYLFNGRQIGGGFTFHIRKHTQAFAILYTTVLTTRNLGTLLNTQKLTYRVESKPPSTFFVQTMHYTQA